MSESEANKISDLQTQITDSQIKSGIDLIKETAFISEISHYQVKFTRLWNIFVDFTGVSVSYKIPVSGNILLTQFTLHSGQAFTITFNNTYTVSLPAGFFPFTDLDIPLPDGSPILITLSTSGSISGIISGIRVS